MKRGRKPTPRALKILRGNPGKRAIPPAVIDLPPGVPECPGFLRPFRTARKEWDRITVLLGPTKVLSVADQQVLAGYCLAVDRALRAEKMAKVDPKYMVRAEKAWDHVRKFGAVFGLGPAERERVKPAPAGAEDDDERFLFGRSSA